MGQSDDECQNETKASSFLGSTYSATTLRVPRLGNNIYSVDLRTAVMAEYFMAQLGIGQQGIATNMTGKSDCESTFSGPGCPTAFKQGFYDKFTFWQRMSGGAMGEVMKVKEKATGTVMVCKMITWVPEDNGVTCSASDSTARSHPAQTVTREVALREVHASLAAGQQSRGVVPVYDVYEEGNVLHMIMEEAKGGDLFDVIAKNGPMNEKDVKAVAKQMLETIGQLHAKNICHRDIKLENIVSVRPSDYSEVKLVDFGLAYQANTQLELASMDRACGTPAYLAPECIAAELSQSCDTRQVYGPQCDLWSLGVGLYALLCGRLPFRGRSIQELARSIYCDGTIDMSGETWNCISSEAKDLVLKLLNRDPNTRITVNEALRHPWIAGRPHDRPRNHSLDETRSCSAELRCSNGGRSPAGTSVNRTRPMIKSQRFPARRRNSDVSRHEQTSNKLPWE